MQQLKNNNGYKIKQRDGYYSVTIASFERNEFRHYEYSSTYETIEQVEKELKECSFDEIVKRYADRWVYLECIEPIQ